jgi:hypothetical protein
MHSLPYIAHVIDLKPEDLCPAVGPVSQPPDYPDLQDESFYLIV